MSMSKQSAGVLCAMAGACVLAALSGCSSSNSRYEQVKADPTPNIDTLYERPEDVDNAIVVTVDENSRMFWQDLGRVFLFDRPSRLAREPIPRP